MKEIILCDKCFRQIDKRLPHFEYAKGNLCPKCAKALYQKIWGKKPKKT